ncbi:MAG: rhodanese-like domain-containing protein [Acidobacteriaceae bacterium]
MDLEIDVAQAHALLTSPEPPLLLDVREPFEYAIARLEPSTHIPMGEIPGRAHQHVDEDAITLILCHHGTRSLYVAAWLRQQGFEKAQSIRGGIEAWAKTIDPSIPRY